MKEIFQEYGGILITVVAILAVIVVITAVIGKDENGAIGRADVCVPYPDGHGGHCPFHAGAL